jgi:hypothetical protein
MNQRPLRRLLHSALAVDSLCFSIMLARRDSGRVEARTGRLYQAWLGFTAKCTLSP